jgi:CRP/FNR family transcriptional regulator, anaerobic regulatory protein
MAGDWLDDLAALDGLEPEARAMIADLQPIEIEAGRVLFSPGAACTGFALVLSGVIRVGINAESGRSLVLYRVSADEVCVQTTLCLMAGLDYSAEGVTESRVRLVMIPASRFDRLMAISKLFRSFVFARFGARLNDISKLLETIAFARVDARLAQTLLQRASADGRIGATHQALADEVGTAREVVSRQLLAFAKAGLVTLGRGEVTLLDRAALESRATVT